MANSKQEEASKQEQKKHQSALGEIGSHVEKLAAQTAESIKKAIDKALASRNTVLTIRVNDESNKKLKMLVDSGLFKSRSESAAFLIEEGVKVQQALFDRISGKLKKIDEIKEELKNIVSEEFKSHKPEDSTLKKGKNGIKS